MSQYQRILLIADPGMQRTPAFERATWLARRTGAALHMALFEHSASIQTLGVFDAEGAEAARNALVGERRRWLQQQAELLRSQGCEVTAEAVWTDSSREEILAHISEYAPDLAIKDVQHESALKRLLLRPLDRALLRESPAPLLLVGTLTHAVPRRVLAAIDVSQRPVQDGDINDRIIKSALALAIQCDAELHLAYAFDAAYASGADYSGFTVGSADALHEASRGLFGDRFEDAAKRFGVPSECRHLLTGSPWRELCKLAGQILADVIALGAGAHPRLERMLLGTTAEAVVEHAPCDVLAVPAQAPGGLRAR